MNDLSQYRFDGTQHFDIRKASTKETRLCPDKDRAVEKMENNALQIDELQQKLYAEKKEGVIFLFQAMDAAGKDGTIRAVLQILSPHGSYEAAFKTPTAEELSHDFLWRVEKKVPGKGEIAIFNRSHYEDVLIGSVKQLYKGQAHADRIDMGKVIKNRYEDICHFEKYLYRNSVRTVKIFLHVSKEEQARRFLDRIEEPEKNWKFSEGDYEERKYWDAYQDAFEKAINSTSTRECPWYVVPADHKWYMRYLVSEIILKTLQDMHPQYPEVTGERLARFREIGEELQQQLDSTSSRKKQAQKKEKAEKDSKKRRAKAK